MNTPSQSYRHKQFGTTIVAISLPALMVPLLVVWFNKAPAVLSVLAAVAGIQVLVLLLFGSLTVEISGGHVRIRFGAGLIRKRWPLDGIEACRPVRTSWIDGWGIRLTRRGWLYEEREGRQHRHRRAAGAVRRSRGGPGRPEPSGFRRPLTDPARPSHPRSPAARVIRRRRPAPHPAPCRASTLPLPPRSPPPSPGPRRLPA